MTAYFEGNDLILIESLVYDPTLTPYYDFWRDCLIWEDERCDIGMTSSGYEKLCDLFVARTCIHLNEPFSSHSINPDHLSKAWKTALNANFCWPGWNRLQLSKKDKEYFLKTRQECMEMEYL